MSLPTAFLAFCVFATLFHMASLALAATRMRRHKAGLAPLLDAPPVSLIRPVCGLEAFSKETLGSSFALDYPVYEIIFCAAHADDPVLPVVRRLIDANPAVPSRLLIGDDRVSPNPKLNNVVKGWDAARHDWIVMADSNVLMPRDYIQRLAARRRPDTGVVCSVPIASRPQNFWAELECAFLNSFQARWEYAADTLGFGFAQGKSMLMRRSTVERGGGIRALGAEIAEDAALTKLLRQAGLKVHLVDDPFEQPLGVRRAAEVWARQRRWSRLRRMTFPLLFVPELLSGSFFPLLAVIAFAAAEHLNPATAAAGFLTLWYGTEAALVRRAGWHWSIRMPLAFALRDLLLPFLWVDAWLGNSFTWRGTELRPREAVEESPVLQ